MNSDTPWDLIVEGEVWKTVRKFPRSDRERVDFVIAGLRSNPYGGDIEKMEGEKDVWRRRIGAYQIKYEVRQAQRLVYVFEIKRRTSTTY